MEIASVIIFYSVNRKEKTKNRTNTLKSDQKQLAENDGGKKKKGTAFEAVPGFSGSLSDNGKQILFVVYPAAAEGSQVLAVGQCHL